MGDLSVKVAGTNSSYKMDKREEISARTQARLVSGAGNHDDLKGYDYFSDAVIEEAKVSPIQPRPRQVPLRDTRLWGMQADKVYVPLNGHNTEIEGNRATFTLFGLNEFNMENFARNCRIALEIKKI